MGDYAILKEGYSINVSTGGKTGSRTYIALSSKNTTPSLTYDLPSIGDPWGLDHPDLLVNGITKVPLGVCDHWKWIVSYSSNSINISWTSESDLPTSMSVGTEYDSLSFKSGDWTWVEGGNCPADLMRIPKKVVLVRIDVQRYVYDSSIDDWMSIVYGLVGRYNSSTFLGFPAGKVMFDGCDAEELSDETSSGKKWLARLRFTARSENWVKVFDPESGDYKTPKDGSNRLLFESGNFSTLFSTLKTPL